MGVWYSPKAPKIHPICKVAWSLLSSVYKVTEFLVIAFVAVVLTCRESQVLRNQTEQDSKLVDLAVSLRDMLAFANEASGLTPIKGGIDVIKEMGVAIQESSKLIQEYIDSGFFRKIRLPPRFSDNELIHISVPTGRATKSVISTDMGDRVDAYIRRFSYLNDQFGRTLGLRAWTTMNKFLDESTRNGVLSFAPVHLCFAIAKRFFRVQADWPFYNAFRTCTN
jgi:hypothetical protein